MLGTQLPAGVAGRTQLIGGKLYLSALALFAGYDGGQGFFGGEDLLMTNTSGMHVFVWSSTNPILPFASWQPEAPMSEQVYNDNSGLSLYSINVNPAASPTYYILGTTNVGPYTVSPVPVVILTTTDYLAFNVTQVNTAISAAGRLNAVPVFASSGQVIQGGKFQLQFSGASGFGYSILASTNLTSWRVIGTGIFSNTPVIFTDTNASVKPSQFYRISTP
jgi:hypothetical protein